MSKNNDPDLMTPATKRSVTLPIAQFHQGPIPDPHTLARYEQIQAGFAERIISGAEHQATHRQSLEMKITDANIKAVNQSALIAKRGQFFAFFIS
jgi:uncharacterized membrane protein